MPSIHQKLWGLIVDIGQFALFKDIEAWNSVHLLDREFEYLNESRKSKNKWSGYTAYEWNLTCFAPHHWCKCYDVIWGFLLNKDPKMGVFGIDCIDPTLFR